MALYRRIQTTFWTDDKVLDDFTPDDKYFYLYLFTNQNTNLCGCYGISMKQMSNETGYSKDTIDRLLDRFTNVHKVIDYSSDTKEILILKWYKYNWSDSPSCKKSVGEQINDVKNKDFKEYLNQLYEQKYDCDNRVGTQCIDSGYTLTNANANASANADSDTGSTLDIHKVISTDLKDMCEPPLDGYDVQGAWEELLKKLKYKQNYPKSKLGSSSHAKRNYMKLFSGAYNSELIDKTVTYAISLYIKDYRESHETDEYLKNLNSWFEDDIEYWWKEAEEYIRNQEKRKQQEEGGENDTTQSDE